MAGIQSLILLTEQKLPNSDQMTTMGHSWPCTSFRSRLGLSEDGLCSCFQPHFSSVTDLILGHVVLGRWEATQTVSGWRWGRLGWLGKCSAPSGKLWLPSELGFPQAKMGRASEIHTLQKGESAWVLCLLGLFSPKTFSPPVSFYDTWWKWLTYPIAVGPGVRCI